MSPDPNLTRALIKTLVWNWRVNVAFAILPGAHRHVAVRMKGEDCPHCLEDRQRACARVADYR